MNTVFVVLKNADFTEGRGPMFIHRIYETFKLAEEYVMLQSGIYGTKQGLSSYQPRPSLTNPKKEVNYNGYSIKEWEVLSLSEKDVQVKEAEAKIKELEEEIEKLKCGIKR
jgi:hypothetical protein